jgi:hypothetical protein
MIVFLSDFRGFYTQEQFHKAGESVSLEGCAYDVGALLALGVIRIEQEQEQVKPKGTK